MRGIKIDALFAQNAPLFYAGLVFLYAAVSFLSPGYDDEYLNIRAIEYLALQPFSLASLDLFQSWDVHPPGAYLLNWLLISIFDNWSLVRLVTAIFAVCTFIYAIEALRRQRGATAGLLAFLFLGLNPALLLWCTGIRWYAYFVPILVWLCIVPQSTSTWHWLRLGSGLLVLGYLSYAAFVIAPPLLWLYYANRPDTERLNTRAMILAAVLGFAGYAYQLYFFLTVHLANMGGQVYPFWRGLLGFAIAQLSNQGVFPVSAGGLFSGAGSAGLAALGIWYAIRQPRSSEYFWPYMLGVAGFLASGLAGKFRNFVVLSPLQSMWYATLSPDPRGKWLFACAAACLTVGNVIGVVNVATHDGTTKNSWNLPSAEVIKLIESKLVDCNNDLVIMAHDPTLTFLLEQQELKVISPYANITRPRVVIPDKAQCVIALKTFAGGIGEDGIARMYKSLEAIESESREVLKIGRDENYQLKQRLDPRYPEYQCELIYMRNVTGLAAARFWQR